MHKTLAFIVLVLLGQVGYCQMNYFFDTTVNYRLSYNPDTSDRQQKEEVYFELLLNDSISLFRSVNHGILDSINIEFFNKGNSFGDFSTASTYNSNFRFDILKNENTIDYYEFIHNFNDGIIKYSEPKDQQHWEITDVTENIAELNCQKATLEYGGRRWHAWFTQDIPISDGPYKFTGLPGLIIRMRSADGTWDFTMVNFMPNTKRTVYFNRYPTNNVTEMTKSEFMKTYQFFVQNKIQIEESAGKIIFPTSKDRDIIMDNYRNNLKKRSNRIEF